MTKSSLALIISFIAMLVALYSVIKPSGVKTAYVDLTYLFDNFDYTKEIKAEYDSITQKRRLAVDSMEFELKVLMEKIKRKKDDELLNVFEVKRKQFNQINKSISESNQALTAQFDNKILTQLSSYILEYGKKHHHTIILGQNDQGNVMYAEPETNITKEVLEYINKKYQGD